jgi:hypothetical protein
LGRTVGTFFFCCCTLPPPLGSPVPERTHVQSQLEFGGLSWWGFLVPAQIISSPGGQVCAKVGVGSATKPTATSMNDIARIFETPLHLRNSFVYV